MSRRYLTAKDFPQSAKGRCRICDAECKGGRRTTCSAKCADTIAFMCSVTVQSSRVEKRDRGLCALCGYDAHKVARIIRAIRAIQNPRWGKLQIRQQKVNWATAAWDALRELKRLDITGAWDMDHIVPVCEGGGLRAGMTIDDAMANLRTLCRECHKGVTAELARRRAEQRRDSRAALFVEAKC